MTLTRKRRNRYRRQTPERLAELFRLSERLELTSRALRSRTRAAAAWEAQWQAVIEWMEDDTAYAQGRISKTAYKRRWRIDPDTSEDPPVYAPQGRPPRRDLDGHEWAVALQAFYWTLPASQRRIRRARRAASV